MKEKGNPNTKRKILEAAETLFAEKGFDAARVDDIAAAAGVNKALIYYYFKSKRAILDDLFNSLVEDLVEVVYKSLEKHLDFRSVESLDQELVVYYDFMKSREKTLRIMTMESLKASEESPPLFRLPEISTGESAKKIIEVFEKQGFKVDVDMNEALVADFFTGMMPMVNFILYREKWSKHFNISMEELQEKFFEIFRITHFAYHVKQHLG